MTEETEGSSNAPGSTAADAAPTQAIPRIPKPPAAKKTPAKKAPAKKPSGGEGGGAGGGASVSPAASTDKGRPREVSAAAEKTSPPAAKPAQKPAEPIGGPKGRTLTASDYASTTKQSPASTSVFPAVKDKPATRKPAAEPAAKKPSATFGPAATAAPGGTGRRASLRLTHVEPWSVTRLSFAISVAMMIVAVVAATIFWVVLDFVGVWGQINDSFTSVLSDDSSSFDVKDYFGFGRVVGLTLVLSAVNVVITTALATIGAHLYNLAAQLMGGVEVTFTEER